MLTATADNATSCPFTSHRDNHKCLTCYFFCVRWLCAGSMGNVYATDCEKCNTSE